MKRKLYSVKSKTNTDEIFMYKNPENGLVRIHLGYAEVDFSVKECREIIENLKKCILD